MIFLARELTIAQLGLEVQIPDYRISGRLTAIRSRYRVFTIPGRRGRHSNRNELATEFGVSPGYIKEIVGGRERVNG